MSVANMKALNMIENLSVMFLKDENNSKALSRPPWDCDFFLFTFDLNFFRKISYNNPDIHRIFDHRIYIYLNGKNTLKFVLTIEVSVS